MKISKLFFTLSIIILVSLLNACGDDNTVFTSDTATDGGTTTTDPTTGNTTSADFTVSLTLKDGPETTDTDITSISQGNPGYLTMLVLDANGDPAPQQVLNVSISKATVDPTSYLTDAAGQAQAILSFNGIAGAESAIVSMDTGGSASLSYALIGGGTTVTTSPALSISLTLKDGAGTNVSVISADNPGFLTMSIVDDAGVAVVNQLASVTTTLASTSVSNVLTDSAGSAQTRLDFLDSLGADEIEVTALLDGITYNATKAYAVVAPSIQLGDNSGGAGTFISGQLALSLSTLSAGGTASVSAYLVKADNSAFSTPLEVTFSTVCASLTTPLATIDQNVTTSSGVANATYQANGCEGTDTITAAVDFGGAILTATKDITVAPDTAGSIKFISATPETITLKGSGGAGLQESSELKFQVVGATGLPIKDQQVNFRINGNAGDLTIGSDFAITNADGEVSAVVQAGSSPFVVTIVATVADEFGNDTDISTQSTGLVISAGLADDNSFTLSADIFNPEAMRYNNESVAITVNLADIYNNPPPTGTSVYFTTEGGSIGSSCNTDDTGRCSVTWLSANPRPADFRATVLAYTQGVESFTDLNGDGRYSDGDTVSRHLPEAFRDDNENATYTAGEYFSDFDNDGGYDAVENPALYSGNLCDATDCSTQTSLNIFKDLVIVFSESFATISASNGGTTLANQTTNAQSTVDVSAGIEDVSVIFSDINGQPLPVGTTINVSAATGVLIDGSTSYTMPNTSVPGNSAFSFTIQADPDYEGTETTARITITVQTPKQNETIIFFTTIFG